MFRGQIPLFFEVIQEPKKSAHGGAIMERRVVAPLRRDSLPSMSFMDNLDFMRPLADGTMKLILTSPPYNLGKVYESRSPLEQYIQQQAQVISECVRLLRPEGSICWQVGNHVQNGKIFPLDTILYHIFKDHGLKFRNQIVWNFEQGLHC